MNSYRIKAFVAFLLLSCISLTLQAQTEATIDGIKYMLFNGDATVLQQSDTLKGDIVIPEKVKYEGTDYTVSTLANQAFLNCWVTSITLPTTVKTWGEYCFAGCAELDSFQIPATITALPVGCFQDCHKLKNIEIPSSITSIGDNCFNHCYWLKSISIPSTIKTLGLQCFSDCSSLESIQLPSSLTKLGADCFMNCTALSSISIPNSVTQLGEECFIGCKNLQKVTLPSSLTSIPDGCFENCSALTNITIPSSMKTLGAQSFWACSSLKSIVIPSGVTAIGNQCFEECSSLASVEIPASVTSIDHLCFSNCKKLYSIRTHWHDLSKLTCNTNIFQNLLTNYVTLHVPLQTKALYAATAPWSSLGIITEYDENNPDAIEIVKANEKIFTEGSTIVLSGCTKGETIHFYTISGALIGTVKANGSEVRFDTELSHQVILVTHGDENYKIAL